MSKRNTRCWLLNHTSLKKKTQEKKNRSLWEEYLIYCEKKKKSSSHFSFWAWVYTININKAFHLEQTFIVVICILRGKQCKCSSMCVHLFNQSLIRWWLKNFSKAWANKVRSLSLSTTTSINISFPFVHCPY